MTSENGKTYKIKLSSKAAKYLSGLDKTTATRILDKLELLKMEHCRLPGIRPLTGQLDGLCRLRIGNYRAVFKIDGDDLLVIILIIGPRGDIYK